MPSKLDVRYTVSYAASGFPETPCSLTDGPRRRVDLETGATRGVKADRLISSTVVEWGRSKARRVGIG